MQDRQVSINENNEQALSPLSQRFLALIEEAWQGLHESTFEDIKRLIESLPEPYKSMSLEATGERIVNDIKLHYLTIVATFIQKAEVEGIDSEEESEALKDVRLRAYRLMELSKHISVESLSDLLKLSTVSSGLYSLSKVEDADNAQNWMYKFPSLYEGRLKQEHLTEENSGMTFSFSIELDELNAFYSWITTAWKTRNIQVHQIDIQNNWTKLLPKIDHIYRPTLDVGSSDAD